MEADKAIVDFCFEHEPGGVGGNAMAAFNIEHSFLLLLDVWRRKKCLYSGLESCWHLFWVLRRVGRLVLEKCAPRARRGVLDGLRLTATATAAFLLVYKGPADRFGSGLAVWCVGMKNPARAAVVERNVGHVRDGEVVLPTYFKLGNLMKYRDRELSVL